MAQVTGRAWIAVNGALLRTKTGAKLTGIGAITRKGVAGAQVWGYVESTEIPGLECTVVHTADFDLLALAAITDATITFECDTGPVFVLNRAWCETAPGVSEGEGEVPCKFGAMSVKVM